MMQSTSATPASSPLQGKPILLDFDGAEMIANAGLTLLRKVEREGDLAGLVPKRLPDLRAPGKVRALIRMAHEMVRFDCAFFARKPRQIVLDSDITCLISGRSSVSR